MATQEISIINEYTAPDSSGDVFFEPAEVAMTLATAAFGTTMVGTMLAPTGADIGIYGKFTVPQNYVGSPVLVIRGAVGQAASALGFGLKQVSRADSEAIDVAYEAEDVVTNSTWTGYVAEDIIELTITITPTAVYVVGDEVFWFFYRHNTNDTQTGEFHLTGLKLQYADA